MDGSTIVKRFDALVSARRSLDSLLHEVEELVVPYRGEAYKPLDSVHEVDWHRRNIFDSTAPISANLLASAIHGNLTSPAVKWFSLQFRNGDLNEGGSKEWLEECEDRLWQAILESDFNTEAAEVYLDLVSLATSIVLAEEKNDLKWEGFDFTAMPVMDCYFEIGGDNRPSRIYRKIRYTRLQMEERFDLPEDMQWGESDSANDVDKKYEVIFCIYWRDRNADPGKIAAPNKRPVGYKYVMHRNAQELEEGGYYRYPAMVIRWAKVAGEQWGHSPAMVCMSDIKQLNEVVAQTSEARAKAIDPPLITTSRGVLDDFEFTAGALVVVEEIDELKPLIHHGRFEQADAEIARLQMSIRGQFYIDKLELKDSPAMTATEVIARQERMFRLMAPTLGRLQNDFLDPLIELMFQTMLGRGQFPEMPPELSNIDLDIEYIGPLPRAQKGEIALGIEQWLGALTTIAEAFPAALDIPDVDESVRLLGLLRGIPSKAMRRKEEVDQVREERAQQQQQVEQLAMAEQAGKAAVQIGTGAEKLQAVQ